MSCYSREAVLACYRRFACPAGVEHHTAVYSKETLWPELFLPEPPFERVTSKQPLPTAAVRPPRLKRPLTDLVKAAAASAPRPPAALRPPPPRSRLRVWSEDENVPVPPPPHGSTLSTSASSSSAAWPRPPPRNHEATRFRQSQVTDEDWRSLRGGTPHTAASWEKLGHKLGPKLAREELLEHIREQFPHGLPEELLDQLVFRGGDWNKQTDQPAAPLLRIVRWSDGRPLFLVDSPALAEGLHRDLTEACVNASRASTPQQARAILERYETAVAHWYTELLAQRKITLPEPVGEAMGVDEQTSLALWPTFRELYRQTAALWSELQAWETRLDEQQTTVSVWDMPKPVAVEPPTPHMGAGASAPSAHMGGNSVMAPHIAASPSQVHASAAHTAHAPVAHAPMARAPVASHAASVASHAAPVASHVAPAASHVAPAASHVAPAASHVAPAASHVAPAAPHVAPAAPHVSPAAPRAAPAQTASSQDSWAATQWYYRDPAGVVQGPFASTRMTDWWKQNFFPADLPVRCSATGEFVPLDVLYPKGVPFQDPPATPPKQRVGRVVEAPPPPPKEEEKEVEEEEDVSSSAPWVQKIKPNPFLETNDQDESIGPSLAESRFSEVNKVSSGLGTKGGRKKAKGKKLTDLLSESEPRSSVWQDRSNAWANPPAALNRPAWPPMSRESASPPAPAPAPSPAVALPPPPVAPPKTETAPPPPPPAEAPASALTAVQRNELHQLCNLHGIHLDPEFLDLLILCQSAEEMSSMLKDNLTDEDGEKIDHFAGDVWDFVCNPFKPAKKATVAAARSSNRRGNKHRR